MKKCANSAANALFSVIILVSMLAMSISAITVVSAQDSVTATPTIGTQVSATQTETPAPAASATPQAGPTAGQPTPTGATASPTAQPSPTASLEPSPTGTSQPEPSQTAEPTVSPTQDPDATPVPSLTVVSPGNPEPTGTASPTPTETVTPEPTQPGPINVSATINKLFTPTRILPAQPAVLTINLYNNSIYALSDLAFTDALPAGLRLFGDGDLTNTCGGTVSAEAGVISLSGGSLPASDGVQQTECSVTVTVTASVPGTFINTIPVGGMTGNAEGQAFSNTTPASATLIADTISPPTISKSFNSSTITAGATSTLRIYVYNNDLQSALTNLSFTDALPAGVTYTGGAASFGTDCGASPSSDVKAGASSVTFSGINIPPRTSAATKYCYITIPVTGVNEGSYTNIIPAKAITCDQNVTNNNVASASLNIQSIYLNKGFNPSTISADKTSVLSITIDNRSKSTMTDVEITDPLPAGLIGEAPMTSTCGGTGTMVGTTYTFTGGTIQPGTVCTLTVTVRLADPTITATKSFWNYIPSGSLKYTVDGNRVISPRWAGAYLYVNPTAGVIPGELAKRFSPSTVEAGVRSEMRITIPPTKDFNGDAYTLTNYGFVDTFPAGLRFFDPANIRLSGCGDAAAATAGTDAQGRATLTVSKATIGPSATCYIYAYVTSDTPGTYTNTIYAADITNDQNIKPKNNISATLYVTPRSMPEFKISKIFEPALVIPGGASTLKITLTNNGSEDITNVSLTDYLASYSIVFVSLPANQDCGFTRSGTGILTLTGGTIPKAIGSVPGTCVITVNVKGSTIPGTYTNTIYNYNVSGFVGNTQIRPPANAVAPLLVSNLKIEIVKGFNPVYVYGGAVSTLSIQLKNPLPGTLTRIAFTDNMPQGMILADPLTASVGTCGGQIAAAAGTNSFSFSGGTLAPGATCTLTLAVTMTTSFNLTNEIPVGAISTFEGITNDRGTAASLSNLPGVSITKNFADETLQPGASTRLTILLKNTLTQDLTGAKFTDSLPAGLTVANPPDATNTCGGTFTALPGTAAISLSGAALPAESECAVSVMVTGFLPGSYLNTIPSGALTTDQGVANHEPTQDTVVIPENPSLSLLKTANGPAKLYKLGETVTYTLTATNTGNLTLTNITITDPDAVMGTCTPAQPATLQPGQSMSCSASYVIQPKDVLAESFKNIAVAGSDQTDPVQDDETVPVEHPALAFTKTLTSADKVYALNEMVTYELKATNIGNVPLTGVTITDETPGVVLGTCTPAQPADLQPGESLVCGASYVIQPADVSARLFKNVAAADSDQTEPLEDDVQVVVADPQLRVVKTADAGPGPYALGQTIHFTITATNIGNVPLTGVTITDETPGVVLGTCTPAQPATLQPTEALVCAASYVVQPADVSARGFTNTATADSFETDPTEDDETVTIANPALSLAKTVTSTQLVYGVGDQVSYELTATNTGNVDLTNVQISDNTPGVSLGSCTPAQGSTLAPNQSMVCQATYTVLPTDLANPTFTNIALADSDQTDPVEDDAVVDLAQPALSILKTATSGPGPYTVGDTVTYTITATNTGNVPLTGVTIADNTPGVVLGLCTPTQPAVLQPGASMSCLATHVVTEGDAAYGYFDNTAAAASDQTGPISDDETVTVNQLPKATDFPPTPTATPPAATPTPGPTQPPKTDSTSQPTAQPTVQPTAQPTPKATQSVQIPKTGDDLSSQPMLLAAAALLSLGLALIAFDLRRANKQR